MTTITITRALSKIKTLTSKCQDDVKNNVFIGTIPNNMVPSSTHDNLIKNLKANNSSFEDKLKEIIKLKKLIAESNLNHSISIVGKIVTVTEALAMKETMQLYHSFLLVLRRQYNKATEEVVSTNMRIAQNISTNTSEISSSADIDNSDLEARLALNAKQLQESMGIQIVCSDPTQTTEEYINSMKQYYNTFIEEIDYVLSEHNAITTIEI